MYYIFFSLFGYFSGSVLYAYLLPKWFLNIDIVKLSADNNPGVANTFKYAGICCGVFSFILKLLKEFLPIILSTKFLDIYDYRFSFVMLSPVLGHAFSFFSKGNGGKAITVTFGVFLGLLPKVKAVFILVAYYLLFSISIIINLHLLRTVITYTFFSSTNFAINKFNSITNGSFFVSTIVIYKHLVKYDDEDLKVKFINREKIVDLKSLQKLNLFNLWSK